MDAGGAIAANSSIELCGRLCSGDTTIRPKQKIHRLALLVDSAMERIPDAPNV